MLALSRAKSMDNTGVAVHAAAAAAAVVLLARLAHAEIKATPIVFDPTAHPHYIQHPLFQIRNHPQINSDSKFTKPITNESNNQYIEQVRKKNLKMLAGA